MKALLSKYRQPFLFCLVGGMNTAVDYAAYTSVLFLSGTRSDPSAFMLLAAQASGVAAGVLNSYGMNRAFTFRREAKNGRGGAQFIRFIAVNAVTLALSYGALWLLAIQNGIDPLLAKAFVVPLTMCVNFIGYKTLVFGGERVDRH
jgi:putative flippase GtrA